MLNCIGLILQSYKEWGPIQKIVPIKLETPFSEGFVYVFAVLGDTATLIDTGNPGEKSFYELKSQLRQNGLEFKDFDHIVLTHMHTDHYGGVRLIQEEVLLPVYVHELARPIITGGIYEFHRMNEFFNQFLIQCGATPLVHQYRRKYIEENWENVHYIKNGDSISIGGSPYKVYHVPGHSQTDILLVNHENGFTFVGDHLIAELSVNAFIEPPKPDSNNRPKPLLQYRESLSQAKNLPLGVCYSSHGQPFQEHAKLIDQRLMEHENRCSNIHKILQSGQKSIFEICQEMYPRLKGTSVFLGLSQIQGHLDLMEERELVSSEEINEILYYRLRSD
ncbi:MBL fold metallo-hydrolase [Bacillus sp. 31A1R]|uniref:MBL fold metallo-hydrolase n=1 Tax=Robertmurraya mangrovi TaxID=3098077 RepID=A0ABU5IZR9_9BACI|nr:MBL fold metallo-hydrolase [Bacillus sp. 31A1R]MDZ5472650.1 MBL fold metallo-hydrolase [Bacillus sp. 31A1R]